MTTDEQQLTFYNSPWYGLVPPEDALNVFFRPLSPPEVWFALYSWAVQQSRDVEGAIISFLKDPSDEGVGQLIPFLVAEGLISPPPKPKPIKIKSIRTRVLECLQREGPKVLDDLFDLAIEDSTNPEAAVRQAVRVLARKGKVTIENGITVRMVKHG